LRLYQEMATFASAGIRFVSGHDFSRAERSH
jgi:hypothetical protein